MIVESSIEIAAPPSKVREVLLNFEALSKWHTDYIKRLEPEDNSKSPQSLQPGDKTKCNIEGFEFIAEIKENSEQLLQWQGPPVLTVSGVHSFRMEPANDGSSTIFTLSEEFAGLLSFLASPYLLGNKFRSRFDQFNKDLKARAEWEQAKA